MHYQDAIFLHHRGKRKIKIHEDINHNIPIAEKIMVRYLGNVANPVATSLMSSVQKWEKKVN
jgi:hypothetical protein